MAQTIIFENDPEIIALIFITNIESIAIHKGAVNCIKKCLPCHV